MEEQKKETWIKVFRGIEDSWLWKEKPFSRGQAWIDLLILAKFKDEKFFDRRGNIVDGKRGYIYRSIRSLAERWGWSRCKASKFLDLLQSEDMIKIEKKQASEKTAIFIVNYDKYQRKRSSEKASEKPVGGQSKASEKPVGDIYKNDKECIKNEKERKEKPAALPFTRSQNDENEDVGIDLFNMSDEEYAEMKRKIENGDIRI